MKQHQKIKVILLEIRNLYWFYDLFFACTDLEIGTFDGNKIGIADSPNPYQLPYFDKADCAFISTDWVEWVVKEKKLDIRTVLNNLRKYANKIVGADGFDTFSVFMPPDAIDEMDFVLKAQGYYKDRDLHNYETGTFFGRGQSWYDKSKRREVVYSYKQLDKLRLSFPCTINIHPTVRQRVRPFKPNISKPSAFLRAIADRAGAVDLRIAKAFKKPKMGVHFIGSLTHVARIRFMKVLTENKIPGRYGITGINKYFWGKYDDIDLASREIPFVKDWLKQKGYWAEPINRLLFKRTLLDYFIIAAPNGFGELSFRHAEALEAERVLICQDLSPAEMMFPITDGHNAIFCKPDFSDFNEKVTDILNKRNIEKYQQIAATGKSEWSSFIKDIDKVLYQGVTRYLIDSNK